MPIDSSIYAQFAPKPMSMADYLQQGQTLQARQQQLQQVQQQMADDQAVRQATIQAGGDQGRLSDLLSQHGLYKQANDTRKAQADYQYKVSETAHNLASAAQQNGLAAKQRIDMAAGAAKDFAGAAMTARTPAELQDAFMSIAGRYPDLGMIQNGAPSPQWQKYFTGDFEQAKRQAVINGQTFEDAHKLAFGEDKDAGGQIVNVKRDTLGNLLSTSPVLQKTATPGELLSRQSAREGHQITLRGQDMTDARARETNAVLKSSALNGLSGDALMVGIAGQDPNLAANVKAAINGDFDTTSRNMKNGELVAALASRVDPNFDQHAYKLKQQALGDKEVTAANAALGHMGDFKRALANMDPQTRAFILNKPLNWLREHASDNPVLGELNTTALSLSEEYGKALGAGQNVTGDQKREAVFNPSKPIGTITANLGAVGNLLNRTLNAKENALTRNRPGAKPMSLLDPTSAQVFQDLGINYTPGGRGSATPQAPSAPPSSKRYSPEEAAQLPSGTHFIGLDGQERVKH